MPCTGQHDCEMELFGGAVGRMGRWAENGAHFKDPDVALPSRPVVLDSPHQPRKQPASEIGLLFRKRILYSNGIRAVGWPQRQRAYFKRAAATGDQLLADPAQRQFAGRIGDGPGAVRPQLVRETVVTAQASDLFD